MFKLIVLEVAIESASAVGWETLWNKVISRLSMPTTLKNLTEVLESRAGDLHFSIPSSSFIPD